MATKADKLRAELAQAELEEKFLAAKAKHQAGDLDDKAYRKIKTEFGNARRAFRRLREGDE